MDIAEMFQLLESPELKVVEETVVAIRDQLGSLSDPSVLIGLVEYYMHSGNSYARDLLCLVRQQQYKVWLMKWHSFSISACKFRFGFHQLVLAATDDKDL